MNEVERAIRFIKSVLPCTSPGEEYESLRTALDALRREIEAQRNAPLTLDELRKMEGEPVWVCTPGVEKYGRWVIVSGVDTVDGERTLYCQGDYTCRHYGETWLAYRRPLEVKSCQS